jgi:group I intron endonuclease
MSIGIYKITSPTKSIYIGQSINIEKRFKQYYLCKNQDQPKLYNSFVKHGVNKHKFEIIHICDKNELDNLEIYYIELYNSIKNGMNCKTGGHKGSISEESRKKLSASLLIANARPETKHKRSIWQIGRKMSKEAVEKVASKRRGTKGHINQIKSAIGNNYAQKEPVEIYKDEVLIKTVDNIYQAAEYVKGDYRNVHRSIKNPKKSRHMGFTFKRKDNENNITTVE